MATMTMTMQPAPGLPGYSASPFGDSQVTLQNAFPAIATGGLLVRPLTPSTADSSSGTFTRKAEQDDVTVVLFDQKDGIQIPEYNNSQAINGVVSLGSWNDVEEITIRVHGSLRVHLAASAVIPEKLTLIDEHETIWSSNGTTSSANSALFSYVIPSTFPESVAGVKKEFNIPPSHNFMFPDSYGGYSSICKYTITVIVSRHTGKLSSVSIPFTYAPRHRPFIPMAPAPVGQFFSRLSPLPAGWYNTATLSLDPRKLNEFPSIECQIIFPSSRVFGIADKIPFHVTLSGPSQSVHKLLEGSSSKSRFLRGGDSSPARAEAHMPTITLTLQREINVDTHGRLGSYKTRNGKPVFHSLPKVDSAAGDTMVLEWEGELAWDTAREPAMASFTTPRVSVKHTIEFEVVPFAPHKSSFLPAPGSLPIYLVSDSYSASA